MEDGQFTLKSKPTSLYHGYYFPYEFSKEHYWRYEPKYGSADEHYFQYIDFLQ